MRFARYLFIGSDLPGYAAASADCPPPKHAVPIPNLKGATYHQDRTRLLAAGWFPVQTKPRGVDPAKNPDIRSGNGRLFWERGYLEVEACAGMGLVPFSLRWADKFGNQVNVITQGIGPRPFAWCKTRGPNALIRG